MWPNSAIMPNVVICTTSIESLGIHMVNSNSVAINSFASAIWPTANKAIFVPFSIHVRSTFKNMFILNGATVSGNVDVGIYAIDGTRLWSAGSTAQAGISTMQSFAISGGLQLAPGVFYMAVAMDNITGTLYRAATTNQNFTQAIFGLAEKTLSFPLPATVALAGITVANIPLLAITTRTVV